MTDAIRHNADVRGLHGSSCALLAAFIALAVAPMVATADQSRLPTIGEVWFSEPVVAAPYMQAFRSGLRDLGYVEGRTVNIVSRFADGDATRLPTLIADLVALKVDVLYVSPRGLADAVHATKTVPIVSMGFADPVAEGFAASLARPGGNVTGISWQSMDTAGKRLEFAKQLVPALRRVAILFDPADQRSVDAKAFRSLAITLGVNARAFELSDPAKKPVVFQAIAQYRPDVLLVGLSPLTLMLRKPICGFAITHRIPLISEGIVMAASGALLTYGPNDLEATKRTAVYIDKILKGTSPADLPIEQPTKFELIVSMKTAKAIGVTVPESILAQADEVIR